MEPLYYLIHRECRYVSDEEAAARRGNGEAIVFVVGATEAGARKRNEQGMGEGRQTAERERRVERERKRMKTGVDSVTQRYRGRSGKLGRGWSESSLSRGQAAT